jgi:O-antigen/teichoic acid export membrane protein
VSMLRGKVRRDLALAFGAQAGFKVGGYVILALLARHLPREAFGQLLYLLALGALLVLFTDLGTSNHLVREAAEDRRRAPAAFVEVLRARIPLTVLFVAGMTAFVAFTEPRLIGPAVAVALYAGLKDLNRAASSVLYGLRHVGAAQLVYAICLVLAVALIVLVARGGATLTEVVLVYLAWGLALLVVGLVVLGSRIGDIPWHRGRGRLRSVLRLSLPLFAVDVLALVHFKVDTVMLGLLRPMTDVAAYEAGAKLLEASQFLVRPLTLIFFPIIAALAHQADAGPRLRRLLPRVLGLALVLGTALASAVALLAPWIIPFVFGAGFDSSVPLLRVLYLSVPGLYLAVVATFSGNALHMERHTALVLLAAVAMNLGLNAVAIPRFGPTGAAWATVASQNVLAVVLVVVVWRGAATRAEDADHADDAGAPAGAGAA